MICQHFIYEECCFSVPKFKTPLWFIGELSHTFTGNSFVINDTVKHVCFDHNMRSGFHFNFHNASCWKDLHHWVTTAIIHPFVPVASSAPNSNVCQGTPFHNWYGKVNILKCDIQPQMLINFQCVMQKFMIIHNTLTFWCVPDAKTIRVLKCC